MSSANEEPGINSQKESIDVYFNEYETENNDNDSEYSYASTNYYDDAAYGTSSQLYESDEKEDDEPELLPEPKEQVQFSSINIKKIKEEEEEDMGYDEDDERLAIAVDRPKELRFRANIIKSTSNGEGSGSEENKNLRSSDKSNSERLRFEYTNSFRRKQQTLFSEHEKDNVGIVASAVDLRESSGNFANDDEDNDDDSDDDKEYDNDGFFNTKRKSNSRYFRKNTNDAIKIISTPLGKVGIVYQHTPTHVDTKSNEDINKKSASSFTDFDALSPDPESSHRLASSHPKITPVLTPDGKVALLYRGDSENSKYEPIRNLTTHKFNDSTLNKKTPISLVSFESSASSEYSDGDSVGDTDDTDFFSKSSTNNIKSNLGTKLTTVEQAAILPAPDTAPTTGSFIIRPTDSILPMINRPLSEVLGIKKNQFKQIRIKDTSTTTEETSKSLAVNIDNSDTHTLHFLTKVNLADYPTSLRARNYDFDFSRDNTMLDERTRNKEHQTKSDTFINHQMIDTNEPMNENILSKTEVINLAIIPHFDEELERLQRLREYEERRHNRQRQRQKQNNDDLSGIHCIMQAMMGIAAISTVFGMLGTFFKQRILDQLRLMHW